MTALTMTPAAPVGQSATAGAAAAAAPAPELPFRVGATERTFLAFTDPNIVFGATSNPRGPTDVPSGGYLRNVDLLVSLTTSANAATVVFTGDAPYNLLTDIQLLDVNGAFLIAPMNGYELAMINKWGGYQFDDDPAHSPFFLSTAGSGATGGSVGFFLRIPVEAIARDAVGALGNGAANATPKVKYTVQPSTILYTTPPTTLANPTVTAYEEVWTQPPRSSLKGQPIAQTPPDHGTMSRWSKQISPVTIGDNSIQIKQVGNMLRDLLFIFRDVSGVRNAALPGTYIALVYEDKDLVRMPPLLWQQYMQERFGILPASIDVGVFNYDFTHDFDGKPGQELRDLWFPTTQATKLELRFTAVAAGTLTVLVNDVVVASPDSPLVK